MHIHHIPSLPRRRLHRLLNINPTNLEVVANAVIYIYSGRNSQLKRAFSPSSDDSDGSEIICSGGEEQGCIPMPTKPTLNSSRTARLKRVILLLAHYKNIQ